MSETLPEKSHQLSYEQFMGFSILEQKMLIYIAQTVPEESDVSQEELFALGPDSSEEEKLTALARLNQQGVLQRGSNPQREKPSVNDEKRYFLSAENYQFILEELPKIWENEKTKENKE